MEYHFDVEIAKTYGVDEAIFVHNIFFWVRQNEANKKNIYDGRAWTYNSAKALTELFPFWTDRQIQRVIKSCKEKGLIETRQLSENKRDRTLYYTITQTVKCIYANGGMDNTKHVNPFTQTVECIYSTDNKPDNKPDRESKITTFPKIVFGEFENVEISQDEFDKLNKRWKPEQVKNMIENLSCYLASNKKKYKNHYAVLLTWLKKDFPLAENQKIPKGSSLIEEAWCCE